MKPFRGLAQLRRALALVLCAFVLFAGATGCGAKSATVEPRADAGDDANGGDEVCNALDDDGDDRVDETFRDAEGRYVHPEHCGSCDKSCGAEGGADGGAQESCAIVDGAPTCVAGACPPGQALTRTGTCVAAWDHLCLPCEGDGACGPVLSAKCQDVGGARSCVVGCEGGCPEGYACSLGACLPEGGSCSCEDGLDFAVACALATPSGELCPGAARCEDGVLSECVAGVDVCDGADNDCDGEIDEDYRDERGSYTTDVHHCGACGIDCTASAIPEGALVCGGDPFAPSCVLDCVDARDGVGQGDRLDADRDIATGCECTVSVVNDSPGPRATEGEELDTNCDGADGIVTDSYYVATNGVDGAPGSPTRPLRSIQAAIDAAIASLASEHPRPHVYVAAGTYIESLSVGDGVQIHGGYRPDFRALDPGGYRVEVRAPANATTPGGAALDIRDAGATDTILEGLVAIGRDAIAGSGESVGAYLDRPGNKLLLRDMEIRAGNAGAGDSGNNGAAGSRPAQAPKVGAAPRGAKENAAHECAGASNVVAGGAGGAGECSGTDVSGGRGGQASCPGDVGAVQGSGVAGRGVGHGAGGSGGQDSNGPIVGGSCPSNVCCGLADFAVPTEFSGPSDGGRGKNGTKGVAGDGCAAALGSWKGDRWVAAKASAGTSGNAGTGGGGGGAGGGTRMDWYADDCEFVDGLGGGGGGGGAGGCGGSAGKQGASGGPSAAIVIRRARGQSLPVFERVVIRSGEGGRGGDGGVGGDGGLGSLGAPGGDLAQAQRSTPTLAGPYPGGSGGAGGNGGPGGGGGGGCGGASVGVWIADLTGNAGPTIAAWRASDTFVLGRAGQEGRGGGGAESAADGEAGGVSDVLVAP